MSSRFVRILNEVEAELRHSYRIENEAEAKPPSFFPVSERVPLLDDLMRIEKLHRNGGVLLEIGGYPFHFSMCLRKLGVDLTTIDLAPERARDLIREHSLRVIACDIESERLPFKNHSVATVVLCATFEHLRVDPLFALEERRRVLQWGGGLYLTTPNLYRLGNVVSFILGRGLTFDPINEYDKLRSLGHMGHVREYTASEIVRFLERAGFISVDVKMRAAPSRRGKLVDIVHQFLPGVRAELIVTAQAPRRHEMGAPS
jgi:SAM-dependent methyltransferase